MNTSKEQWKFCIGRKQEITFRVDVQDGIVQKIYNAYVYQPIIKYKENSSKQDENKGGK